MNKILKISLGFALVFCFGLLSTSVVNAADTVSTVVYIDSDNDGSVDTVRITMDENVTACAFEADDWAVTVAGSIGITSIDGATCTGADAVLDLDVTAGTDITGGATAPTITYTQAAGTANSVTLTSGNMTDKTLNPTDGAAPIIKTVTIEDTDNDGLIDKVTYTWSENIDTNDGAAPVIADLPTTLLPDGQTAVFTAATVTDPEGASAAVVVTGITGQVTENTAAGSTAISGNLSALWKDVSAATNAAHATGATANETVVDAAEPIVLSVLPANGVTSQDKNSQVVITFSEAMDTSSLDFATDQSGTFTETWSVGDTVVNLVKSSSYSPSSTVTATLTTVDDIATVANSLPAPYSWSFSIKSSSGGGGGGGGGSSSVTKTTTTQTQTQTTAMVGGLNLSEIFALSEAGFTTAQINQMFGLQTATQAQVQSGGVSSLKPWTNGNGLKAWQQALMNAGYNPGPIDGIWGPKTEAAIKAFQSAKGLVPDGIPGPLTTAAMNESGY